MKDYRVELMNQTKILENWLDVHAYDARYTQVKARKALYKLHEIWNELERRGHDRTK
jgi:hypothetical protein